MKHILVPLDGSTVAEQALPHAVMLARAFDTKLVLARVPETLVVPVVSGGIWITREIEPHETQAEARTYLEEVAARDELSDVVADTVVPHHPVAEGLADAAREADVGLLVMTTHGRSGVQRWVFGSVADKLIKTAPVPLYIVPAVKDEDDVIEPAVHRLLVPLDGSELAELALAPAAQLARASAATLMLVRVPTVPGYTKVLPETGAWIPEFLQQRTIEAELYLEQTAAPLAEQGISVTHDVEIVTTGSIADGIIDAALEHDADAIVMSTHGRTGAGRWLLGSVADAVLRGADLPVWLVRAGARDADAADDA